MSAPTRLGQHQRLLLILYSMQVRLMATHESLGENLVGVDLGEHSTRDEVDGRQRGG
jgi:hypothetical protein